jgi:hypothetical protein
MRTKKTVTDGSRLDAVLAEAQRDREKRSMLYRDRALRLFPHICGRCGREFSGKKLRELTVHHKDHNHDNNPPDGSNWELLCIYCHDMEHAKYLDEEGYGGETGERERDLSLGYKPFAGLQDLFKGKS